MVEDVEEASQRNKIYLPVDLRKRTLQQLHQTQSGHLWKNKFLKLILACYYWRGINNQVEEVVDRYLVCNTWSNVVRYWPLQPISSLYPFRKEALDTGSNFITIFL